MKGLTEGRIVHFVLDRGTNHGQHRSAIVSRVWRDADGNSQDNGLCQLTVFMDGTNDGDQGLIVWRTSVVYNEDKTESTWHWVEPA